MLRRISSTSFVWFVAVATSAPPSSRSVWADLIGDVPKQPTCQDCASSRNRWDRNCACATSRFFPYGRSRPAQQLWAVVLEIKRVVQKLTGWRDAIDAA